MLSETWFSANTCRYVRGYTGFHTYRAECHVANFLVSHAHYEFSVVRISLSNNNCAEIIIGVYRPTYKSKIPEFTIKLNEVLSSTSPSDHIFIVDDLNINLLDPTI